jgi:hypothetical protein
MRKYAGSIVLSIVWIAAGLVSIALAITTPFLFDAPGSESSPLTVTLAIAVAVLPPCFFASVVLRWVFRWKGFFLLPVLDLAVIGIDVVAIDRFCGGSFTC